MQNDGKLISFEITKKGANVTYTSNVVEQGEMTYKEHTIKVERSPSDTLKIALKVILGHALIRCGLSESKITEKEIKNRKAVDMPAFRSYTIDKLSIKGDGDDEKVSIKITKTTSEGDTFSFTAPDIAIVNDKNPFEKYLAEDLDNLIKEAWEFVEGKNYFIQGDLFKNKKPEEIEDDL